MLSADALNWLRCPADPKRQTPLELSETHLTCTQCRLKFRIRDGIPNLLVDEAELPEGCASLRDLPCRQGGSRVNS